MRRRGLLPCLIATGLLSCKGDESPLGPRGVDEPLGSSASAGGPARASLAATITAFAAQPRSITPGSVSVLSWTTQGATGVRLAFPTGAVLDQPANGSVSLTFERRGTFTYTLTALGGTPATASVTVSVGDGGPNRPPSLVLRTTPPLPGGPDPVLEGRAPFTVSFSLCGSSDPDENPGAAETGDSLNWQFHFGDEGTSPFGADGSFNPSFERFCRAEHTYRRGGTYTATLSVTDKNAADQGADVRALARDTRTVTILVNGGRECGTIATDFDAYADGTAGDSLGIPGVSFGDSTVFDSTGSFATLSGQILSNNGTSFDIVLAEPATSFRFEFASYFGSITLEGFLGGSPAFSRTLTGAGFPPNFFAEGTAQGGGVEFDVIRLSGDFFVIDNFKAGCE